MYQEKSTQIINIGKNKGDITVSLVDINYWIIRTYYLYTNKFNDLHKMEKKSLKEI